MQIKFKRKSHVIDVSGQYSEESTPVLKGTRLADTEMPYKVKAVFIPTVGNCRIVLTCS